MAYETGLASSYMDIMTQLINICIANGWSWSDSILSKNTCFLRVTHNPTGSFDSGSGLLFQGGTGKSGSNLINPSSAIMRLGPFGTSPLIPAPVFPIQYHIFVFDNPDEVYLVVKYEIDRFMFVGFGKSIIEGNGLWISASLGLRFGNGTTGTGINISEYTGGLSQSNSYVSSSGFWWQSYNVSNLPVLATQTIYTNIENIGWSHQAPFIGNGNTPANQSLQPLLSRLPAAWSSETILLPIQPYILRASFKTSILADIQFARYLRIDNLEPEQILNIGNQKWMVFPFHKKNSVARNGGSAIDHTGTFGWAIKYDGY
ncbi:hypothetical protein [Acinetobacter junii]|uniref:hypothetical protein n=1 Tax=Acinetobacter junii TaxID=40215 RepID=UPI00100E25C6|nr:hypothetical protein [Acinetobacter junii]RXS99035.1 hypothetical protein ETZ13_04455 [Acinetobacter junii]